MKQLQNLALITLAALTVVTVTACSSAIPSGEPGVDRLGDYILRQEGAELEAVLGYRFASKSIGEEWLILELAVTSPNGESAEIEREDVFVQTPAGEKVPLATQAEFADDYRSLRSTLTKADVARDPMGYFPPSRYPCVLRFFTEPGQDVVYNEVSVNDRRACEGRLLFEIPGGIQPGRYVLGIDLEETDIRIPFTL